MMATESASKAKKEQRKVLADINESRNNRKVLQGVVVSNKMNKTIVVAVETSEAHWLYKKVVKNTEKYKAHDENNECSIGDKVEIMETRHLSKDKYFRLVRIIEKVK